MKRQILPPPPTEEIYYRLFPLDAIRGIAAMCVVFGHYCTKALWGEPPNVHLPFPAPFDSLVYIFSDSQIAGIAVQIFFSLSGFIFTAKYLDKIAEHHIELQEYAILRFSRLYPLCWFATTIMLIIRLLFNDYADISLYQIIKSYTLMQYWVIDTSNGILGTQWTLALEISSYFIFFLLASYCKRKNGILLFAVPIVIGAIFTNIDIKVPLLYRNFMRVFPAFFMGVYTCMLYKFSQQKKWKKWLDVLCIAVMFYASLSWINPGFDLIGRDYYTRLLGDSFFVFPAIIISFLNIRAFRWFFSLRFFRWLGAVSFSVYLLHWPILYTIGKLNASGAIMVNPNSRLFLLLVTAAVLAVSTLSHYLLEKPIQNAIRKRYYTWRGICNG
jgi:peptidoglycan/LPS O-acetylase OafA/YrhL